MMRDDRDHSTSAAPGRLRAALLALASAALLSLAFAPLSLASIAWVGLVPWLLAVRARQTIWGTFLTGWLSGIAFFAINVWWLWTATIPGTIGLVLYLSLYWGLAAALVRGLNVLATHPTRGINNPMAALLLVPIIWTAVEWVRAYLIPGFPWMLLGYSQTPLLAMCQIADLSGTSGITFWVVLVNTLVMLTLVRRGHRGSLAAPAIVTASVLVVIAGYGLLRLRQQCTYPGPSVMVVQPNHPHLRGGARTVSRQVAVDFHLAATRNALAREHPDLVVWSETVMPPLNPEARRELTPSPAGQFILETHRRIGALAAAARTTIITGGHYVGGWAYRDGARVGEILGNAVYCYTPDGRQSTTRYDKRELVPFAERVPFESVPWLHALMLWLSPPVAAQPIAPGDPSASPAIFVLEPRPPASAESGPAASPACGRWRFASPICLENACPPYVARLVGAGDKGKDADFIVNLSNDGWFHPQERWQHWQAVSLRCIEDRVPMARSANTGISGLVDSCGRTLARLGPGSEGTAVARLPLDRRVSIYSRWGEWFGTLCVIVMGLAVLARIVRRPGRIAG